MFLRRMKRGCAVRFALIRQPSANAIPNSVTAKCIFAWERTGAVFFRETGGCSVHVHKPAVCRAWPFFKGNLIDPVSFSLAKEYCPGISRQVAHADFVAEGIQYIRHEELFADDRGKAGAALFTREDLEALARSVSDSAGERGKQA